jgi:hypothetical protein
MLPVSSRRSARLLAVWLAVCLVGTQIAGLHHRIEHPLDAALLDHDHGAATGSHRRGDAHAQAHTVGDHAAGALPTGSPSAQPTAASQPEGTTLAAHHCAAFDAATLGDGPPAAHAATEAPAPCVWRVDVAPAVLPSAGPRLAFRSRAPPRA